MHVTVKGNLHDNRACPLVPPRVCGRRSNVHRLLLPMNIEKARSKVVSSEPAPLWNWQGVGA